MSSGVIDGENWAALWPPFTGSTSGADVIDRTPIAQDPSLTDRFETTWRHPPPLGMIAVWQVGDFDGGRRPRFGFSACGIGVDVNLRDPGRRAAAHAAARTLDTIADPTQRPADFAIRLRSDLTIDIWHAALAHTCDGEKLTLPAADPRAAKGLKFSDVLPEKLAAATVSVRLADLAAARAALRENVLFRTPNG